MLPDLGDRSKAPVEQGHSNELRPVTLVKDSDLVDLTFFERSTDEERIAQIGLFGHPEGKLVVNENRPTSPVFPLSFNSRY